MDRKRLEEVADKLEIDYGGMTDEEIGNAIEEDDCPISLNPEG